MSQQRLSREQGERRAILSMQQLLCAVCIWRTAMTRILPVYGSGSWWIALACLLPGIAVAAVYRWAMAVTGTATVTEAARVCLGQAGSAVFSLMLAAALLVEGASTLNALLTVFTQGVGTRGTQFTLALLTGSVLLFCMHREGLPRAVYLLRWGMLALLAGFAVFTIGHAKVDNLFPLYGTGDGIGATAWQAGISLGWPIILLLTVPPCGKRSRLRCGILPIALAVGLLLLTILTVPQEVLAGSRQLADLLLLPIRYVPNALRVACLSLLMLSFFLTVGAAIQGATNHMLAPLWRVPTWLPSVILIVLVFTQTADVKKLWAVLGIIEPWILLPLAGVALILLPTAIIRRKKA